MLLTDAKVRNAKPKAKFYRLRDGNSLFLQVEPKGGKYWRLMYRYAEKQKTLALGTYPDVSLGDARDKAHAARKTLASGTDPGALKQEVKRLAVFNADNTFEAVAKEWFETNKPLWTPDHAERNKVRAAYNRAEYLPQRRAMMQTWADLIDGVVSTGKVVFGKFKKVAS